MEKKTIGSFIATLRKANGMTQKALAEKLNVSDKTISRWERDDGAPDLSVIPVIAEIFGVTCDELLRGEKRAANEVVDEQLNDTVYTAKAEKQMKWLIETAVSKYKSKTTISVGIAIVGLLTAMIANFGFRRANIGFFVAIIFYLVSVVCQIIFSNEVKLSITNEDFGEDGMINVAKQKIAKMKQRYFGVMVLLVGFVMPLIIFARYMYEGIVLITWFVYGTIIGAVLFFIYCIICYFVKIERDKWAIWR